MAGLPSADRRDAGMLGTKRSKKNAAAENRIVYVRQLPADVGSVDDLKRVFDPSLATIVSCHILPKTANPSMPPSAFVVFDAPQHAAAAIAAKTGGCTLPRHKRVDVPDVPLALTTDQLFEYLSGAGEIKQMMLPAEYNLELASLGLDIPVVPTAMVEFVSAMGAAKAIVWCREHVPKFGSALIKADYAPSNRKADGEGQEVPQSQTQPQQQVDDAAVADVVSLADLAKATATVALDDDIQPEDVISLEALSLVAQPEPVPMPEPEASAVSLADLAGGFYNDGHLHDDARFAGSHDPQEEAVSLTELALHASPAARVAMASSMASNAFNAHMQSQSQSHSQSPATHSPTEGADLEEEEISLGQLGLMRGDAAADEHGQIEEAEVSLHDLSALASNTV
ncbi:hypothetical protein BC831DRAFT_529074 [Entophlyctis helioformis]|nr:hypothetical protein BC831DRAFT_529074 [Entophlyctis helioformis]